MRVQNTNATLAQVKGSHLIVEVLGDEVIVFDRRTNKAHILDPRAAAIWRAAENGCSLDDVALLMEAKTPDEQRTLAQIGIADLNRAGLVTSDIDAPPRRSALKTLGRVAALPIVISILAPTPAAAASNLPPQANCVAGVDTCQSPILRAPSGMVEGFLCQDPILMGGHCCVNAARTDVRTNGVSCTLNDQCCSLVCDMGVCKTDLVS